MVVKNKLDLINLARDEEEQQILEMMLNSIDYVIETAHPHKFMSLDCYFHIVVGELQAECLVPLFHLFLLGKGCTQLVSDVG